MAFSTNWSVKIFHCYRQFHPGTLDHLLILHATFSIFVIYFNLWFRSRQISRQMAFRAGLIFLHFKKISSAQRLPLPQKKLYAPFIFPYAHFPLCPLPLCPLPFAPVSLILCLLPYFLLTLNSLPLICLLPCAPEPLDSMPLICLLHYAPWLYAPLRLPGLDYSQVSILPKDLISRRLYSRTHCYFVPIFTEIWQNYFLKI